MLVASLILAALAVVVTNAVAYKSRGLACLIAGLSILLGLPCVIFPAVMLNGMLLLLAALLCWVARARPQFFLVFSLAAFVVSHVLSGMSAFADMQRLQALRNEYPTQSLAGRLAYERKQPESRLGNSKPFDSALPPANSLGTATGQSRTELAVDARLNDLEGRIEGSLRTYVLQRLHDGTVNEFINSPGFGISREIRPSSYYIELPESKPIALPKLEEDPSHQGDSSAAEQASPADTLAALPVETALRDMHRDGVVEFVNAKGFGYVKDREHVAGFQAHQFRALPKVPESPATNLRWQIQSLELVSLLKHEEPVAYLSEHLPRMDELRNAKTRPLSAFEKQALAVLQEGEDLKIESTVNRIQMLGSIRAVKQCLSCHSVERGELLGAFSYALRRDPPLR